MLSASTGFAVPEKILNRSSFTAPVVDGLLFLETLKADSTSRTRALTERCASYERTRRARESRKRRSDRAETQQRLGAPSLGSGKFQTPPNRYPPARLLSLL